MCTIANIFTGFGKFGPGSSIYGSSANGPNSGQNQNVVNYTNSRKCSKHAKTDLGGLLISSSVNEYKHSTCNTNREEMLQYCRVFRGR